MRTLLAVLVLVIAAIVGFNYYSAQSAGRFQYQVQKVRAMDIVDAVAVTGYAEATDLWVVQSEMPGGVVEKVYVNFNDEVKEGQVLATLNSEIQKINLEKAKSDLERAESAVDRAKFLLQGAEAGLAASLADLDAAKRSSATTERIVEERLIPKVKADTSRDLVKKAEAGVDEARSKIRQAQAGKIEAESQVKAAQIAVELAQYYLDKTVLRSKWRGIVLNKDIREGDVLGGPKFSLNPDAATAPFILAAPLDHMQAIVKVSEADYSRVKVGQKATFKIDAYPDETFEATVVQVRNAPNSDRTAVSYATVLKFDNRRDKATGEWMVKPRSTVTADIVVRKVSKALAVPSSCFYFSPGQGIDIPTVGAGEKVAWRVGADGRPQPVVVKTGISDGSYTQIEAGDVAEGDEVIVGRPKEEAKSGFSIPLTN